jgi:DNA-binding PadR family transcriptional regulator
MPGDLKPEELPLTEVSYFILLSLAPKPRHGYGMMLDVKQLSHGRVVMGTGTLYGAIKRLLELGWIAKVKPGQGSGEVGTRGRPRKEYTLTWLGRRLLTAEITRLRELVEAADIQTAVRTA